MATEVQKATAAEYGKVAMPLARAFADDLAFRWMVRDDRRIGTITQRFFDVGLRRIWSAHDEMYTTPDFAGGAVWEKPGVGKPSVLEQLRMLPSFVSIFGRHMPRMMRAMAVMEKMHPKEPHYYLPFVGVDPARQGEGIGSALLRPVLDRCDREGVPAYLEATSPSSRVLYERLGWQLRGEPLLMGDDAPPMWPMWREPAS